MRPRIVDFLSELLPGELIKYFIPTGTMMFILAILVGMWVFVKRCEKSGLSAYHALGAVAVSIAAGLLGARIYELVYHLEKTIQNPRAIFSLYGGTTSWGGYSIGFLAFFIYFRVKKIPGLPYADALTSALGLGPFIARWTCFLNGCCYGSLSDLPWAVRYPNYSPIFQTQLKQGLISSSAELSLPVHPVQIYASFFGLVIFLITSRYWYSNRRQPGKTFTFYWLIYCLIRFGVEFFRGDMDRFTDLQLTLAQIICLIVVLLTTGILVRVKFKTAN